MSHETSGFRFYSLGVVAENKAIGAHECEVIPLESNNFYDGELTSRGEASDFELKDKQGRVISDKIVSSTSIKAIWTGIGDDNRITPPDVRRGEEVMIYTFADTGKYFWKPRNTNRHLRKLETVVYGISATTDEGDSSVTDKNHYILELSSHKKHIVISTTDRNGEKCRWFIQVRGSDGKFLVADDQGNEFSIDSVESVIKFINKHDTEFTLDKKDARLIVPGNHTVDVTGGQTVNVKGNQTINVGGNADINVGGTANINAGTYNLTSSTITFNGNLVLNGHFNLNGALTSSGGGSFAGAVNFAGGHGPH